MNIPTTKQLSNAERFCVGLKLLAEECNMSSINYSKMGIKTFKFKDGSFVGGLGAYISAGLIKDVENE